MKPKPSPYQRIVRAAKKGVGVKLTARECWALSHDDAIATVANNDDEDDSAGRERGSGWLEQDPSATLPKRREG